MGKENKGQKKPWGGRFKEPTEALVEELSVSVHFDKRLYREDIKGSIAHARMLGEKGIIPKEDAQRIIDALVEIEKEIQEGKFSWKKGLEDVHMNIERALIERIGPEGGRLHTARSRNDQVATDFRLYLKREAKELDLLLSRLQGAFIKQAEDNFSLIMPGFTHLQKAQPVLYSHHMLAYFEMFKRDRERLRDFLKRVDYCPLGSAALAGTGFPIDRFMTARELGFSNITANSMDAVSDRDFALEFLFFASVAMMHLSRLSEELILWASDEFDFVELPDAYCTGSSIMPQKKNPDVPELVRGKTGRVYGDLISLLTTMKGLPLTYNRDLQEDKEPVFDAIDTLKICLKVMAGLVERMKPKAENMERDVKAGFLTATDLADYLVKRGIPFRTAHEIVGRAVAKCVIEGKELSELSLDELKEIHEEIREDVFEVLDARGSVNSKNCPGGTGEAAVREQLIRAKRWLEENSAKTTG